MYVDVLYSKHSNQQHVALRYRDPSWMNRKTQRTEKDKRTENI